MVYLALHYMFVRPMRRVTGNMMAFRADPENPDRIIAPSARADEIGIAERELATMQSELASMLHQKSRLAALGLAVSKINHDLRNLLASAQLFSDRLANLPDPTVQRFAPKLMRALERAIAFCQSTLSYGRVQEPPPERRQILLEPLVEEVHETLNLGPDAPVRWISAVERGLIVEADYDQLFRILLNLARNAVQAMESRAARDPGRDQIRVTAAARAPWWSSKCPIPGQAFPGKRGTICSRRSRARPLPAAPGSTSPGIAAELVATRRGCAGRRHHRRHLAAHHPDRAVELVAAQRTPPWLEKAATEKWAARNHSLCLQRERYSLISFFVIVSLSFTDLARAFAPRQRPRTVCAVRRRSVRRFRRRQRASPLSLVGPAATTGDLADQRRSL